MPKSFLVKKAKHREDQSEQASTATESATNNEGSLVLGDAIFSDKSEDTLRRLHNLSGENTLATHGKTTLSDTRSEQMFDADRKNTAAAKQVTGNGEVIPRHMWFFPSLLIQEGNPYAKFCVPTSKLQAPTSKEGSYVIPVLRNGRQRRESVLRLIPEGKMPEDGGLRERVIRGTQAVTNSNKHILSQHLNATLTNCMPPKEFHPIPSRVKFAHTNEKGEHCGIYPFNLRPSGTFFEPTKRNTMEGERDEEMLSAAGDNNRVLDNSHISDAKKRRSEGESVSPKRFRNLVDHWDNEKLRSSVTKDGVLVLDNSQFPEAMKRTRESPERFRNSVDHWKNERHQYGLWEAKRRKTEENTTIPEKGISSEIADKRGWKQSSASAVQNEEATTDHIRKSEVSKNNHYNRSYDWFIPVSPYLNSIRATERNRLLSYRDHTKREKSKAESSSIWFPDQLSPTVPVNEVMTSPYKKDTWKPELKRFNGLLRDAGEKEIFISNEEDIKTKWTSKNSKGWLADNSRSPNLAKEYSTERTRVDIRAESKDRFLELKQKLRDLSKTTCEEESMRSCSPDQSIINTAGSSSITKREKTVKTSEYLDVGIPINFSSLAQTCRSVGSLRSPEENRTSVAMTDETKREQLESLSTVNTSENCSDIKKENTSKTLGFQDLSVPTNLSPLVRRDYDRPVCSVRSPEQNWTNVTVIDENKHKHLESSGFHQDEKEHAVVKSKGKVFSDHSTLWLLNKETKTANIDVHCKLPAVNSSPPFWTVTNGCVPSHLRIIASKTQESLSKGKVTVNTTSQHRCEICNTTFPLRRLLNRHLKTHSFYKRYSCSYCKKGFNDTFDLKRHVRTHTGIKPFKCEQCDKSFTQRCSLEAHQSRVHSISHKFGFRERRSKMFVCEQCGAAFKDNQSEFMNHMASAHPETDKAAWVKKNNRLSPVITF